MDRQDYLRLADACLERVARWLEDFDPDELDFSTTDGMVSLQFADGTRFVLNRQSAADQMWFAAVDQGWHYNWNQERGGWVDHRDGHDLFDRIGEVVGRKLKRGVDAP